MIRVLTVSVLLLGLFAVADEKESFHLAAPEGWGGETISLPPGFAKGMTWQGTEHIRFAPGMMKATSDSFFSYAFVFELEQKAALTDEAIQAEFLKYYRGLCEAVLNGKRPDVDPSKFTLVLKRVKADAAADQTSPTLTRYTGQLDWVEPFATKKPQQLQLEIQTWTVNEKNYLFACVSPQARDQAIWKQLRKIRDDYLRSQ